jgi:hypothetical protein
MQPTLTIGQVVQADSAIIGDALENQETIYVNHVGMTKFSRKDNAEYRKVLYVIEMLFESLAENELTSDTHGM